MSANRQFPSCEQFAHAHLFDSCGAVIIFMTRGQGSPEGGAKVTFSLLLV
jgi:hypothetical protein